jgi:hypothetical protein
MEPEHREKMKWNESTDKGDDWSSQGMNGKLKLLEKISTF